MTALFVLKKRERERENAFLLSNTTCFHCYIAGAMFGITRRGLKRDHRRRKLSAVSKQFRSLSLPSLVPSPSAPGPPLLGGRVAVSGSLEPYARLRILAFFAASASIRSHSLNVQLHT